MRIRGVGKGVKEGVTTGDCKIISPLTLKRVMGDLLPRDKIPGNNESINGQDHFI